MYKYKQSFNFHFKKPNYDEDIEIANTFVKLFKKLSIFHGLTVKVNIKQLESLYIYANADRAFSIYIESLI